MNAFNAVVAAALAASITAHAEQTPVKSANSVAVVVPPAPLTIGELSAQARQKRIADEIKPAVPAIPPGMNIEVPSTAILGPAAAAAAAHKTPPKKAKPAPPPEVVPGVLAIAKNPAGSRFVELADTNGADKYVPGQTTPSGWTVVSIGAQFVELSKPATKKKPARRLTLSLVAQ